MAMSFFLGGSKPLSGWFGALIYRHNGDFANFLKLVPESNRYLGNAQMQST